MPTQREVVVSGGGRSLPAVRRTVTLVCYGARIRVGWASADDFEPHVLARLPHARRATAAEPDAEFSVVERGGRYVLFTGSRRVAAAPSRDAILEFLESAVHQAVAQAARGRLFVHAGVVGWNGRAIVIPGRTMTGKSTLVAALAQAGADYYSDEFAVLDRRGMVRPYHKRLSLRRPGGWPDRPAVEDLGGRRGHTAIPLGLVVVAPHAQGSRWQPRPISRADAMMALFDNTVLARVRPQFALSTLERAVTGCWGVEGPRGDAGAAARHILRRLDRLIASERGEE